MEYQDIDWNMLWQDYRRTKSWKKKKDVDWDRRAASFAKRHSVSSYATAFFDVMQPQPQWSVLDVGSGPGTLSLPLSKQVEKVTALDFSSEMLAILAKKASDAKCGNLRTMQLAWEDDWQEAGVGIHDVAIASRSLAVQDLRAALLKLDAHAKRAVFIGDRVGAGPFYPELFKAVGREFRAGPDYIFTVNLLYQMGIYANVNLISAGSDRSFATREEALESITWMIDDPSQDEQKKLAAFMDDHLSMLPDGTWVMADRPLTQWAVIWWRKDQS